MTIIIIVNLYSKKANIPFIEVSNAIAFDIKYDNNSYTIDMTKRIKNIGELKIKYYSLKNLIRVSLPEKTKEYKINIKTNDECSFIMNYAECKITAIVNNDTSIKFLPYEGVCIYSEQNFNYTLAFETEKSNIISNLPLYGVTVTCFNAGNGNLYRYENGFMIESDNVNSTTVTLFNTDGSIYNMFLYIDDYNYELKNVWMTIDNENRIVGLIDIDNDGIYETNIAGQMIIN